MRAFKITWLLPLLLTSLPPAASAVLAAPATPTTPAAPAAAQEPGGGAVEVEDPERSERLYRAHCGRCHGVQGLGGEGPELAQLVLPRVADRTQLEGIIRDGIPGTGMPGARATILDDEAVALVAGYVLWLGAQTTADASGATGDADRGHDLYQAADCASCHIVAGRGTAVGPELTIIGLRRGPEYLREALSAPAARLPIARAGVRSGFFEYLPVRIVTRAGDIYNGMRMNEDSFTIQLMTVSGVLVSLEKSQIAEMEKRVGHSLMPLAQDLDEDDVEDLVAYLTTLGRGS